MFPVRFLVQLGSIIHHLLPSDFAFQKEGKRAIAMIGRGVFGQNLPRNVYIARKT